MRKILILSALVTMLSCERATVADGFKTIMIRSVGELEVVPDEATFHVELYCVDRSVKSSKECLVTKSNDLMSSLEAFGINKNDILTTAVNMDKSYSWRNNTSVFDGYRTATTVTVKVRDIEKLDELYTELLENRNLDIGGLQYSHSQIDSLHNEAYLKALSKSDVLADKLLSKLPESKKEILKIGNVELSSSTTHAKYAREEMAQDAATPVSNQSVAISRGTMKLNATLNVEYRIR